MFNNIKSAFQSFKKNWQDYLAISFVFGVLVFIGVLVSYFLSGMLLAYIIVIIPAIMSLKFCTFQAYGKEKIEYRSLKIGFITFFKSVKIYSIVILKPLLIAFLIGCLVFSFFLSNAITIAGEKIPNLVESLSNYETFIYTYEEMIAVDKVGSLMNIGLIVSFAIGYLIYFSLKLKRDFIPFVAFEMPMTSKRAIAMNEKVLKGSYLKFFVSNLIVTLMFAAPVGLALLMGKALSSNEVLSPTTITLVSSLVFCLFAGPIATVKQLHYISAYKSYSKPFKEDFDNELKNVIKEIEELQKIIDKKDEK